MFPQYFEFLSSQESGLSGAISNTDGLVVIRRYADPGAIGHTFRFKLVGDAINWATAEEDDNPPIGDDRPEIREAWAWGYIVPHMTDRIQLTLAADDFTGAEGTLDALSGSEKFDILRRWYDEGVVLTGKLNDYEEGRLTRFIIVDLKATDTDTTLGVGGGLKTNWVLHVTLLRVDYAAEYAADYVKEL